MKQRIITAIILALIVIGTVFFLPLQFFMLVFCAVFLLASKEWAGFVGKTPSSFILYLYGVLLALTLIMVPIGKMWGVDGINPIFSSGLIIASVWWVTALIMVISYPKSALLWSKSKALKALFGIVTLIPFFWGIVAIRTINMQHQFYTGSELLMYVFVLVWASDTGGYFFGKKLGKHKLLATVSPGKTIEGFLGGLFLGMAIAVIGLFYFAVPENKDITFLIISFITILCSVLGDLTESIFKRESGLKDSGHLFPGHGGILDRIDSLTAAVPIFALCYLTWLH